VRIIRFHTLLGLILLLLLSQVQIAELYAQATRGQGEEIVVTADKLAVEEAGKVIRAEGNVEVKRGEMTGRGFPAESTERDSRYPGRRDLHRRQPPQFDRTTFREVHRAGLPHRRWELYHLCL
jgi:hypothetical protein